MKFDYLHVSLPPSKVLEYRAECQAIMRRRGVRLLESGVWNEPELFSMVLSCRARSGREATDRLSNAVDEALMLAQDVGGSIEYCHGVGIRLAHLMQREHGLGLEVMRKIKRTLDPASIMNPGKQAL